MSHKDWAGLADRYGSIGESGEWSVIFDHYLWDRLPEAYQSAKSLGAGMGGSGLVGFRSIEGEYRTRQRGEVVEWKPWLDFEFVADEVTMPLERIMSRTLRACDSVARRTGFEHGPKTLISVLTVDSNVPWMPGRQGYCIDKYPYEKICIPANSFAHADDYDHLIQHEYSHVINLNLSEGKCPVWLDEAVAMALGGGADLRAWKMLANGEAEWLGVEDLDRSFRLNREDERERSSVWLGYEQAAVIGHYLESLGGTKKLGQLMRAFSNNSVVTDLLMAVRGTRPSEEALQEVYGLGIEKVFAQATNWLKDQI